MPTSTPPSPPISKGIKGQPLARPIEHAAIAVANPVEGDLVLMTNYPW